MSIAFVTDEDSAPRVVNVLAYGPPGAGKTAGACTAPGPILYLNAEGPNALAYGRKIARERGTDVHELRVDPKAKGTKAAMDQLVQHVRSGEEPRCRTVVIDTIGRLRDGLINEMVQTGSRNSLQQFGLVADALATFVQALRDLPVNLVLLAHESVEDGEQGDRIVRPMIGGKQTEMIPAEVDVVAYLGTVRDGDAVSYMAQFVERNGRRAKDRSGGLGTSRPTDMTEWFTAFRAALGDVEPEAELEPPAPVELVSDEDAETIISGLREAGVTGKTVRSWLIAAGVESVPTSIGPDLIRSLTPEQGNAVYLRVLKAQEDQARAAEDVQDADEARAEAVA